MPLTYDQLSSITEKKFIPKMYDNIFDSNPLLKRGEKKFKQKLDGGESIMVPLNYAQTSASGWYSGADTLDTTDNQNITAANYSWKQLFANISIMKIEELKNSGDAQKVSLVKSKVKIAEKTMSDLLGTGLYSSGSDPKSIAGLRVIVSASNTVGGISQSTYSWWQSQIDSSTTTLSIAAMQERWSLCSIDSDHPTVIMAGRSRYDSYYNLL